MAHFVGAFGVPHVPIFAMMVKKEGASSETGQLYAPVREALQRARPDSIVMFDTDHLNTFFFDCLPMLAIGVDATFRGPNDEPPALDSQTVVSDPALAAHIRAACMADGYDAALVQNFDVDHSVMIPLHFLTPALDVPVVPIFINGHIPPLPSAARALAFGQAVRRAIDSFEGADPTGRAHRVAVVGSGSFSLEVLGPRIDAGQSMGVPDPGWAVHVTECFRDGDIARLVHDATESRMAAAGNVAGELLNWLAMIGATGSRPADWIAAQPRFGHSFAFWEATA